MAKRVFLICSVRNAPPELEAFQREYVSVLEQAGVSVYFPPRDTDQTVSGLEICRQNLEGMRSADEVHVVYRGVSQGTHFDMGMAFALGKKVVVAKSEPYGEGKSYPRMLDEWQESSAAVERRKPNA